MSVLNSVSKIRAQSANFGLELFFFYTQFGLSNPDKELGNLLYIIIQVYRTKIFKRLPIREIGIS